MEGRIDILTIGRESSTVFEIDEARGLDKDRVAAIQQGMRAAMRIDELELPFEVWLILPSKMNDENYTEK